MASLPLKRSLSPSQCDQSSDEGGVFFWRINQANYTGAGASAESLLLEVLAEMYVGRAKEPSGARLVWANCFEEKLWASAGHCLINHFPRSVELSHKHRLCSALSRAGCRHLPPSFVLPQEKTAWLTALRSPLHGGNAASGDSVASLGQHWILKPGRGGGGRGVRVLRCDGSQGDVDAALHLVEMAGTEKTPAVVSQYVERPLLVAGRKIDLRLYALVTSFGKAEESESTGNGTPCSLTAYIFTEGLVRFASEEYSMSAASLENPCVHLTNNEVNARNSNRLGHSKSSGNWTLGMLWRWLRKPSESAEDQKEVWQRIRALAFETLDSARPAIARAVSQLPQKSRSQCFELFGLDVLLDEQLWPWLCEVNSLPSLGVGGPVDIAVDKAMLRALFAEVLRNGGTSSVNRSDTKVKQDVPASAADSEACMDASHACFELLSPTKILP